jgi:hypothetical protein
MTWVKKIKEMSIIPGISIPKVKPPTWVTHDINNLTTETIAILRSPIWPITAAKLSFERACAILRKSGAIKEVPNPLHARASKKDQYANGFVGLIQ